MDQAQKSGKTLGELAKDSDASADITRKAFESDGSGIEKAFGDAAKAAQVTMTKNLIDVILGVSGAAEKAARDANFFLGTIKD